MSMYGWMPTEERLFNRRLTCPRMRSCTYPVDGHEQRGAMRWLFGQLAKESGRPLFGIALRDYVRKS